MIQIWTDAIEGDLLLKCGKQTLKLPFDADPEAVMESLKNLGLKIQAVTGNGTETTPWIVEFAAGEEREIQFPRELTLHEGAKELKADTHIIASRKAIQPVTEVRSLSIHADTGYAQLNYRPDNTTPMRTMRIERGMSEQQLVSGFWEHLRLNINVLEATGEFVDPNALRGSPENPWVVEFVDAGPVDGLEFDRTVFARPHRQVLTVTGSEQRAAAGAIVLSVGDRKTAAIPIFDGTLTDAANRIRAAVEGITSAVVTVTPVKELLPDGPAVIPSRSFIIDCQNQWDNKGLSVDNDVVKVRSADRDRQTLRITATAGEFTLGVGSQQTRPIQISRVDSQEAAIGKIVAALSAVGADVRVSNSSPAAPWDGVFDITFVNPRQAQRFAVTSASALEDARDREASQLLTLSAAGGSAGTSFRFFTDQRQSPAVSVDAKDTPVAAASKILAALTTLNQGISRVDSWANGNSPWESPFVIVYESGVAPAALGVSTPNLFMRGGAATIERRSDNSVQTLSIIASKGSFRLSYGRSTSEAIEVNAADSGPAAAQKIEQAIRSLTAQRLSASATPLSVSVRAGSATSPWNSPFTITFEGPRDRVAPLHAHVDHLESESLSFEPNSFSGIGIVATGMPPLINSIRGNFIAYGVNSSQASKRSYPQQNAIEHANYVFTRNPSLLSPVTHVFSEGRYFSSLGTVQLETNPTTLTGATRSTGLARPALLGFLPGQGIEGIGSSILVATYGVLPNGRTSGRGIAGLADDKSPLGADIVFTIRYDRGTGPQKRTVTLRQQDLADCADIASLITLIQAKLPQGIVVSRAHSDILSLGVVEDRSAPTGLYKFGEDYVAFDRTARKPTSISIYQGVTDADVIVTRDATIPKSSAGKALQSIICPPTDNTFYFGNFDSPLTSKLTAVAGTTDATIKLLPKPGSTTIEIDTSLGAVAGSTLTLDFRASTDDLVFRFTQKQELVVSSSVFQNEFYFSNVDTRTTIYPGRNSNTFIIDKNALFSGRIVGGAGYKPLTNSAADYA
jgi:hypothetical protein